MKKIAVQNLKLLILEVLLLLLCPIIGFSQTPNDNGTPVKSGSFGWGTPMSPASFTACPASGPVLGTFTGTTTQLGRIFRDAIPSACPSKVYPGIFNTGTTYNYETYTYSNTSNATACVTVNFDPNMGTTPCGTNAHASAYLGSYDPNNQATNFVGDVGSSLTQPFSFDVPANSDVVLVVTNTGSQAICDFAFEVVGLPCTPPSTPTVFDFNSNNKITFGDPCRCADTRNCESGGVYYFHDTLTIPSTGTIASGLDIRINSSSDFYIAVPCFGGLLTAPTLGLAGTRVIETSVGSGIYKIEFWRPSGVISTLSVIESGAVTTAPASTFEPICTFEACFPVAPAPPIPSLSQWGLFIFCLLILNLGLAFVYRVEKQKQMSTSSNGSISNQFDNYLPYDKSVFHNAMKLALGISVAGLVFIYIFWGEVTNLDLIMTTLITPLIAYLIHIIKLFKNH